MKICPKCKKEYGDEMNFCLTDGSTLKDSGLFSPEDTIALTDNATLEYQSPQTGNQNRITNHTDFGKPKSSSAKWVILFGIFGVFLLLFGTILGGLYIYYRVYVRNDINYTPTPIPTRTPYQGVSPSRTPTPQLQENVKVEILEKVKNNEGQQFLKCKVTNLGETIVSPFSLTLLFYQGDVKLTENAQFTPLRFLKPQQSIPVWVSLYKTENYTSVKVKDSGVSTFPVRKTEAQIYPELAYSETQMERGSYRLTYVRGIVENRNYEKLSTKLFVIFYDEKSEIVGFADTSINLQKGEKAKFQASISDRDLFGTPKRFEIIAISD